MGDGLQPANTSEASDVEVHSRALRDYRTQLVEAEQASQTAFDRTLLTLSGGALGLSITFVGTFLGRHAARDIGWLWASWVLWALGLSFVLTSHYVSTLAMRRALQHLDRKRYVENPGGAYEDIVRFLNPAGGVLFLAGVATIIVFAIANGR